jgi:hypothetical protein
LEDIKDILEQEIIEEQLINLAEDHIGIHSQWDGNGNVSG